MPLFAIRCLDKPASLDLRLANRPAHLAYVGAVKDQVRVAGPLLDTEENMAGTLLIMEFADLTTAEAFAADDPYNKAGLFQRVEVTAFKATLGGFSA